MFREPPDLPPAVFEDIDARCDRFEDAWLAGCPERIEDLLEEVDGSYRAYLFRSLLAVELDQLRRRNQQPSRDGYAARFPDLAEAVNAVFSQFEKCTESLHDELPETVPPTPSELPGLEQDSSASLVHVKLSVTEGPHAGRTFTLDRHETFFVGRSIKAHFSLPRHDRYFSRMHFLVEANPPLVRVVDLGSHNGTYVNGTRITATDLKSGDRITAGHTVLEVALVSCPPDGSDQVPATVTPERLPERFAGEWQAKRPPRIDDFLPAPGHLLRLTILREIVLLDLEQRCGSGDQARVEDYLLRFAELKSDADWLLEFVAAEANLRRRREPGLDFGEYTRRFPGLQDRLQARLGALASTAPAPAPRDPKSAIRNPPLPGYRIGEKLGRGGMGVVYRAVREKDGLSVAIKVIHPAVAASRLAVARFLREVELLRHLNHRCIVALRGMGQADPLLWFAMDLVNGTDLGHIVKEEGPLETARAAGLVIPLLGVLAYAHAQGFVHRDIKPSNVLVARTAAGAEEPRLVDFGLARIYQANQMSGLTLCGSAGGTPGFMPPEQILNFREAKPPADQYSMAATLYFLLTAKSPFITKGSVQQRLAQLVHGKPIPLRKRRPELPEALEAVLDRALSKEPEERYRDVTEFAEALQPFANS